MIFLLYFLKVFLYSGILFGYYYLFLRNRRFHHYNRFYLLATLVLSVVLPFVKIPVFNEGTGALNGVIYQTVSIVSASPEAMAPAQREVPLFTLPNLTWLLYTAGVLVLLFLFFRSLWYIRKISRLYSYELVRHLKFYQTQEPGTPFSFFRSVFWNDQLRIDSPEGQQVFRHELFHVQQKHTVDIVLAELITIAGWFNPFFHLMKKELKAIHEFLADQYAASGSDRYAYAEMLVQSIMKSKNQPLTHPFFQNHIKRRITMIIQHHNTRYSYWSRLMVLPVSLLLFFSLTLYAGDKKQAKSLTPDNTSYQQHTIQPREELSESIRDTVPADEQKRMLELKLKAEEKVIREKQLILQKQIQEKISRQEEAKIKAALQKEMLELKIRQETLEQIKANLKNQQDEEEGNKKLIRQKLEAEQKNAALQKVMLEQKIVEENRKQQDYNKNLDQQQATENNKQLQLKLEDEKVALDIQQKQLMAMANEQQKVYRLQLQAIEQKKEALEKVMKENNDNQNMQANKYLLDLKLQESNNNSHTDSTMAFLMRFINKRIRFPQIALDNNAGGEAYFSIDIDEQGQFKDHKIYDALPAEANGKAQGIMVVGYSKKVEGQTAPSREALQQSFNEYVEKIFTNATGLFGTVKKDVTPGRYFFKVTFRFEKVTYKVTTTN